jgi:hypothetical protein
MAVQRYRSVEDVPPAWRSAEDPTNLRNVAMMMRMYSNLTSGSPRVCGVRRFRTIEEANEDRGDPYRTERLQVPSKQAGNR